MRNQNHEDELELASFSSLCYQLQCQDCPAGKADCLEHRSVHAPGSGFREPMEENPAGEKGAAGLHVDPCQQSKSTFPRVQCPRPNSKT